MGTAAVPLHADSLYRPIERAPRKFNPLKVSKSLQVQCSAAYVLAFTTDNAKRSPPLPY